MKLIWNIVHFATILVLISSIGVPIISNQSSVNFCPSTHSEQNYDFCTEILTSCCAKSLSNTQENDIQSSVCLCNPLAESCCCTKETEFVFFQFDVPICSPKLVPHFVQAYSSVLNSVVLQRTIQCALLHNHLPPSKTFSQQLSVFQVFRL